MKLKLTAFVAFLLVVLAGFLCIKFYSFVFAKTVHGQIIDVQHIEGPAAIVSGQNVPKSQIFSFAVAIRETTGDIMTASSEDRQWAVAQKGQCAEAKYFPYPPWELDHAGTYHDARLIRLYDCEPRTENKSATQSNVNSTSPTAPHASAPSSVTGSGVIVAAPTSQPSP